MKVLAVVIALVAAKPVDHRVEGLLSDLEQVLDSGLERKAFATPATVADDPDPHLATEEEKAAFEADMMHNGMAEQNEAWEAALHLEQLHLPPPPPPRAPGAYTEWTNWKICFTEFKAHGQDDGVWDDTLELFVRASLMSSTRFGRHSHRGYKSSLNPRCDSLQNRLLAESLLCDLVEVEDRHTVNLNKCFHFGGIHEAASASLEVEWWDHDDGSGNDFLMGKKEKLKCPLDQTCTYMTHAGKTDNFVGAVASYTVSGQRAPHP